MASDKKNILTDGAISQLIKRIKSYAPSKLATPRKLSLDTAVNSTTVDFDGSKDVTIPVTGVKEAYLEWGGRDIAGAVSPTDAAMVESMCGNRLSFINPDAITIEYSTDNGVTWVDYGASNADKTRLVTNTARTSNLYLGKHAEKGLSTVNDQLRITISAKNAGIYFRLRKTLMYISIDGGGVSVDTEYSTIGNPEVFEILKVNSPLLGWGGWNVLQNTNSLTEFGGSDTQTTQTHSIRYTFKCTKAASNATKGPFVRNIFMYGETSWALANDMRSVNRMYSIDENQNCQFPAKLTVGAQATNDNDVPTKKQMTDAIDNAGAKYLKKENGTVKNLSLDGDIGTIDLNASAGDAGGKLTLSVGAQSKGIPVLLGGLADPVNDDEATTKAYVDKFHRIYTVDIPTSGWMQQMNELVPSPVLLYEATVSISGVLATDIPEVFLNTSKYTTNSGISDYIKAYNMIIRCESRANAITFIAYDKPTKDLKVDIRGLSAIQSST